MIRLSECKVIVSQIGVDTKIVEKVINKKDGCITSSIKKVFYVDTNGRCACTYKRIFIGSC